MKRAFLATLLAALPLSAAISNLRVTGVTNTQAILAYDAPDGGSCLISVSENSSFTPVVYDVDPTKFPGSELDNRPGNVTNGTSRVFVIGKRSADLALDNTRYSRALQAYTTHYYAISCPSTGDFVSGQFQTANIAMGRTYTDPAPPDPLNPGGYAWPTLSMSDRTQQIIDPQTGALLRRVSLPQDRALTQYTTNQPLNLALSNSWSNPASALTSGAQSATINGNDTGTLFISTGSDGGNAGNFFLFNSRHENNYYTLDWYQAHLTASTTNTNCNTSATADCNIVVCLTIDGVNCNTGGTQFQQPLTTSPVSYSFGTTGTPIDLWQGAGVIPPNGTQVATAQGQVSCNGTPAITQISGSFFATYWSLGSDIQINGQDYKISSVSALTTANLTSSCPSGIYNYYATNFGVLVRKQTASADTISVQNANASYQVGVFPYWDYSGDYDLCSTATVVGPTGNPGYNCSTVQNGAMYWIDSITGEAHLIALNQGVYNSPTGFCGVFDSMTFDPIDPDIWYCGGNQPQQVQYFGNHSEPTDVIYPGHLEEGENLPVCNSSTNPTIQPCLLFTALTGATTMSALMPLFDSEFQADRFLNWNLSGVENGLLKFRNQRGDYGSIGWTIFFDPNATSNGQTNNAGCVGGGQPGCIVAALPSWTRPNARWCTQKSNDYFGIPGWTAIGPYFWSSYGDTSPGVGPYISNVIDGSAFSATPGVQGGLGTCPPNPFGVTGQQCTTVTVNGEPYDPSPCTASTVQCGGALETGLPGEIGTSAPGDYFVVNNEQIRLLAKNGNTWTFQRGYDSGGYIGTSSPNPALYTACNSVPNPLTATQPSGEFFWDYALDPHGTDTSGSSIVGDPYIDGDPYTIAAHTFAQDGLYINSYSVDPRCPAYSNFYYCYELRNYQTIAGLIATPPSLFVQQDPFFAGQYGPANGNEEQEHPAGPGLYATGNARQFFWDGRPFNGSALSGSGVSDGGNPAVNVAGQLWKFTASQTPNLNRKFLPTFAFAGYETLIDVSGAGSSISSTAQSQYTYCVTNVAGECYSGSSVGDVYVNAPFVNRPYCHTAGQDGQMPDEFDLCIGNNAMVFNSIMQVGVVQTDNAGKYQRMISKGLSHNRFLTSFYHPHALSNGNWIITDTNYAGNVGDMIFAVKVPPPPSPDSTDRGNFIALEVTAKPPSSVSVTTAFAEFGYAEDSLSGYFCTTRAETCAVGRSSSSNQIDPNNPFYFETSEATLLTGTPCAGGCTIAIPVSVAASFMAG
jgi:hypothetical protein